MLLKITNVKKYFGQRKIIDLDQFTLFRGDKVAVTGRNGSGKTTLLRLIAGEMECDTGNISIKGTFTNIPQFFKTNFMDINYRIAGKLNFDCGQVFSGGEKTRESIAKAFSCQADILLADEPTTNLDIEGICCLEEMILGFRGGLMIVSHDRVLLKKVCNKVLEIDNGTCKLYSSGYDEYLSQKSLELATNQMAYDKYVANKDRLKKVAIQNAQKSARIRKAPKRMGNSEARLHKMGGQKEKAKLDRSAKAAVSRLNQLEKVKKPWKEKDIVFDVKPSIVHSNVLVCVNDAFKAYDGKSILEHSSFTVLNNKKTALVGANGAGKTTIIDMIALEQQGVTRYKNLKIGYFRQDISNLDYDRSILENAMHDSLYDQCFTRTILSRLLFKRDDINKKTKLISGGERIKLSLAKIILSDFQLLILDEPTNFLDIASRNALESVLRAYPGAILFVSHDREFVASIAERIVYIQNKTTHTFEGGLEAFMHTKAGMSLYFSSKI